ncbi:MAG: hypothetical protein U0U66_11760 [Cytophagaceae bacterium]
MKYIAGLFIVVACACTTTKENAESTYECVCQYQNLVTKTTTTTTSGTISNMSKEDAEIECSNYGTSDDTTEIINCSLK